MPQVASFLFGFLPQEDLITVLLSSDCVRSTVLILFQMKGFTAAKILGGQLRRWDGIWAEKASLLLELRDCSRVHTSISCFPSPAGC